MTRLGVFKPILVRTLHDGTYQIIGGEHRARVAARNNQEVPIINLGQISDQKAKEIGLVDNGRYGADDALSLAEIIDSIGHEDISTFMPYSDSEIAAIFSSTEIDLSALDIDPDVEEPQDPNNESANRAVQTHQLLRFKVPMEDAHLVTDLIEKTMKEQGFSESDHLTNAGDALIHLFGQLGSVSGD